MTRFLAVYVGKFKLLMLKLSFSDVFVADFLCFWHLDFGLCQFAKPVPLSNAKANRKNAKAYILFNSIDCPLCSTVNFLVSSSQLKEPYFNLRSIFMVYKKIYSCGVASKCLTMLHWGTTVFFQLLEI